MTNKENSNSDASCPRQEASCCSPRKKGVHYQLSFTTAQQLGFDLQESRTIAKSNEEVDKCYKPEQDIRNYWRHFDPLAWLPFRRDSRDFFAGYYLKLAVQSGDVSYLGTGLHSLQDKFAHGLIPFQKDLPVLKRFTGTWRDNPQQNPKAFEKTKSATYQYLRKFFRQRNAAF